ncbi:diacylglycerol kinase family lipid kinase [Mycobacterium fragae]|uniref:Diacylglycerol kinase n=1 Tax=Mycobacterium fragae TaxID=1260918 RepID=A0A1X1UZ05_9MYCO|nr:diacylglycerol kinase family protein [Mycobacterium fragae]MCV7401735.1 diacylglycerol kinase family lipid kinase [Mycobacterium fragae]ORV62017.1 diacylglycerol kinase [Mycobacterium fragae]
MRAVLIVNPTATSTTPAARDLLTHALQSRLEVTVEHTTHRGHGGEIAQAAAEDGVDLVVVHGGDGTVSNVVNGLLGRPGELPTGHVPAVAIVPGGSANVMARSLGIFPGPIDATNQLIDLLDTYGEQRNWRRIGLIDCGERWAVFNAGMGVDAEAVAAVEAKREKGVKVTPSRYIRAAVRATLAYSRREPRLTVHLPGREPISGVHFVFVSNSSPWTYANDRPMWTNPDCTFESGLGVFGLTALKVIPSLRLLRQMFAKRPKLEAPQLVRDDNAACVRVTCAGPPMASQFDGDYLGERAEMTFRAVADALPVVAPPSKSRPELGK